MTQILKKKKRYPHFFVNEVRKRYRNSYVTIAFKFTIYVELFYDLLFYIIVCVVFKILVTTLQPVSMLNYSLPLTFIILSDYSTQYDYVITLPIPVMTLVKTIYNIL